MSQLSVTESLQWFTTLHKIVAFGDAWITFLIRIVFTEQCSVNTGELEKMHSNHQGLKSYFPALYVALAWRQVGYKAQSHFKWLIGKRKPAILVVQMLWKPIQAGFWLKRSSHIPIPPFEYGIKEHSVRQFLTSLYQSSLRGRYSPSTNF